MTAPADTALPVVEVFGPTIQGEGPAAGRCAAFVRFAGCNLSCSWCDSAYTWDAARYDLRAETTHMTVPQIRDAVLATESVHRRGAGIVVLTGGEPLLQQGRGVTWRYLLRQLADTGRELHLETNGTIGPNESTLQLVDTIVVSPKLPNAGAHRGHQDPSLHPDWRTVVEDHDIHLKVVCADHTDVEAAAALAERWSWPRNRVWVMPEGQTVDALAGRWKRITEHAAGLGLNASHRLHVLAWGHERGH